MIRPRRFALSFALALLSATSTLAASTAEWVTLIPTVESSIVRLEAAKGESGGICTAVIFEIDKDDFAAALTAAHCVQHEPNERLDLTVSGRTATIVSFNKILDLAIVRYHARKNERAIPIADALPLKGTEVMVVGYPFGVKDLAEQFGHVAQHNEETKTTWLNVELIFGNSGGAAVDGQGRLVGINSAILASGPAHLGIVVTVDRVQDYVDSYHAMLKKEKKP